jgi:MFS family permease
MLTISTVFYYGTTFFKTIGLKNAFVISMITTAVNVGSTPLSFWAVERFGRRMLLIYGAVGMLVCEFVIAIVGTVDGQQGSVRLPHRLHLLLHLLLCLNLGPDRVGSHW